MPKKKEKSTKKEKVENTDIKEETSEEPSWYHYLIVIGVIVGIFFVFYIGFEVYENLNSNNSNPNFSGNSTYSQTFKYPYKVGNITYNLNFYYTTDQLDSFNYTIEPNKLDILNSRNFTFVFKEYNGTDNGRVGLASTKLMRFLRIVYKFDFNPENFVNYGNYSCLNSTRSNKIIVFDPYKESTGVFFNRTSGCINIDGVDADQLVATTDKFMYELTKQ